MPPVQNLPKDTAAVPVSPPGLTAFLQTAIGPGTLAIKRVQLWDLYSRRPVYLDANLAGQQFTLFDYEVGQPVTAINNVATSPAWQARKTDTNIQAANNNPYNMFIHGLALDIQLLQHIPGTVGSANDVTFWGQSKQAMLADTFFSLKLNDTTVDKLTFIDAPAAGGVAGFASMGTTAALTVGASVVSPTNGWPDAGNFRSYLNEGPFFAVKNSTIEAEGMFGNSMLTANFTYKPAATADPTVFLRAVLKGMRIWNI